jgi:hypothetical protein
MIYQERERILNRHVERRFQSRFVERDYLLKTFVMLGKIIAERMSC